MPPRGLRYGRKARPGAGSRSVDLEQGDVRVVAGRPAAKRVDPTARRGCGEMLARGRAGHSRPASGSELERQRDAGEPAAGVDAAHDVQDAVRDRRRRRRPSVRKLRERAPASLLEDKGRPERPPVGAVPAEDVDPSVRARRRCVVDRDRQVRQSPPAILRNRVRVGPRRVRAGGDEAADGDDRAVREGGGYLGPWLRQRRMLLPGGSRAGGPGDCCEGAGKRDEQRPNRP